MPALAVALAALAAAAAARLSCVAMDATPSSPVTAPERNSIVRARGWCVAASRAGLVDKLVVRMFTQVAPTAPAVQLRCARVRPVLRMRAQGRRVGYARVGRVVRLAVAAAGKYDGLGQVVTVLGSQWGDEGKGKLVDILAQQTDVIVRAQVHPRTRPGWTRWQGIVVRRAA